MKKYEMLSALLDEYCIQYKVTLARALNSALSEYDRQLALTYTRRHLFSIQEAADTLDEALENHTFNDTVQYPIEPLR